ncbi:hypothetical protein RBB50_007193 [Rhinocladiella similis]
MLLSTVALLLLLTSLARLAVGQEPHDASHRDITTSLLRLPKTVLHLMGRSLEKDIKKRCSGTCAQCFGTGYTLCPDSDSVCYLPGDYSYGLSSCPGYGGTSTSGAVAAPSPSSADGFGTQYCSKPGATCVNCFGAGYLSCPDGVYCYNPNDPNYDTCPDTSGGGGGGSTGGGSLQEECVNQFGSGSVPCGSQSCYNPSAGESCCQDGFYCPAGESCASIVGKCCLSGSVSCSGSSESISSALTGLYSTSYTASNLDVSFESTLYTTSSSDLGFGLGASVTTTTTTTTTTTANVNSGAAFPSASTTGPEPVSATSTTGGTTSDASTLTLCYWLLIPGLINFMVSVQVGLF